MLVTTVQIDCVKEHVSGINQENSQEYSHLTSRGQGS